MKEIGYYIIGGDEAKDPHTLQDKLVEYGNQGWFPVLFIPTGAKCSGGVLVLERRPGTTGSTNTFLNMEEAYEGRWGEVARI